MGWGSALFLGSIGNQAEIQDVKRSLTLLKSQMSSEGSRGRNLAEWVEYLRAENGELKLYLAALIRMLLARNVIDPQEFRKIVEIVDVEDGAADGKYEGDLGATSQNP